MAGVWDFFELGLWIGMWLGLDFGFLVLVSGFEFWFGFGLWFEYGIQLG